MVGLILLVGDVPAMQESSRGAEDIAPEPNLCAIHVNGNGIDTPAFEKLQIFDGRDPDIQLELVDLIVVSESGQPDSRIPSGLIQLVCTPEEYRMLFPDVTGPTNNVGAGKSGAGMIDEVIDDDRELLEFYNSIIAKGSIPIFAEDFAAANRIGDICLIKGGCSGEPPCSGMECLEYDCNDICEPNWLESCLEPECMPCDSFESCTDTLECKDPSCIPCDNPSDCWDIACEFGKECQEFPCIPCLIDGSDSSTFASSSSGTDLTVTVVFPEDGDPQQPKGRCNEATTIAGKTFIESEFGKKIDVICYHTLNPDIGWSPSAGGEVSDVEQLFNSCKSYSSIYIDWANNNPDRILCWVREASKNGVAQVGGPHGLVAETPTKFYYRNFADMPLALHEMLHTFGARHFPVEDGVGQAINWACGVWANVGNFPFSWYVWVSFERVMNYCHLGRESTHINYKSIESIEAQMGW